MEELEVNCYSGHTYAQRPLSFRWRGTEYQVEEIEKRVAGAGGEVLPGALWGATLFLSPI